MADSNIVRHDFGITRNKRNINNGHKSIVVWLSGLSGSGKSTLSNRLQEHLFSHSIQTYSLDGDNTRMGINSDLGFTDNDRKENIRRVAEICKLMNDAGLVVLSSFISPFAEDRLLAKRIIGEDSFFEVYVNCPLHICESRDVKGLYKKARNNEIKNFTGIDSPFEAPVNPDVEIRTDLMSIEECILLIAPLILNKISLK